MKARLIHLFAFIALTLIAAIGFINLTDYSTRPGASGIAPERLDLADLSDVSWDLERTAGDTPVLLFFYHPKCPCTAATVRVLERLLPRTKSPPAITAFAYCPQDESDEWIQSRTTETLSHLDNTRIVIDRGGELSARFGAMVSGHILLYGSDRRLSFSGGITPYRGHEGDSPGSIDLLHRINSPHHDCRTWAVFGCSIDAGREPEQ
ncbi:MAG: hypothetical protein KDB00_04310 [Planctomycetales bacterium]|nr:hypothetical protein [Planctomycetales bacterium]